MSFYQATLQVLEAVACVDKLLELFLHYIKFKY